MALITLDPTAVPVGIRSRIAAAVGTYLQLGRNATQAEIEGVLMADLRALVTRVEDEAKQAALVKDPAGF